MADRRWGFDCLELVVCRRLPSFASCLHGGYLVQRAGSTSSIEFLLLFLALFRAASVTLGGGVHRQDRATGLRAGYGDDALVRHLPDILERG